MAKFDLTPKVDSTQEFIEIAYDFSNPLDLVREAISNSFDASAKKIEILFNVEQEYGERILKIELNDNGNGMDRNGLQSFFDLGNSTRRGKKTIDNSFIGEKGHGTKVYLNSSQIVVVTIHNGIKLIATMKNPIKNLHDRKVPVVNVEELETNEPNGTNITILGYNKNRRDKFTHENLKDYILWFTKMGSFENEFGYSQNNDVELYLKGVDKDTSERISFGHVFPQESKSVEQLFEHHLVDASKFYCKKIKRSGSLKNYPEIHYDAILCIEGTKVKYSYNPMIKHSGYTAPNGAYTVQERYGLWLCKDFMPIQRKNEWISPKGTEYTRFHAFINCQDLRLTANRGSIENTPSEYIEDIKEEIQKIYNEIIQSNDWKNLEWLDSEITSYMTVQNEKRDFEWRIRRVNSARVADYKGIRLVEPSQENGVFALFMQLSALNENLFPFTIIDYDTHVGIDVIVKEKDDIPIFSNKLYYVEFKNYLKKEFNHSFENLHSIVCWDIDPKIVKNNDKVTDIAGSERTLKIVQPARVGGRTSYFLDDMRSSRKIEIFVLKKYLEEVEKIVFRVRTEEDSF